MQQTPTEDTGYAARAAKAEHDHEAVLTMVRQSIDTLCAAIAARTGFGPYDLEGLNAASAAIPRFGVSNAADRCRVAEEHLVSLVNGLELDLTHLLEEAEKRYEFPELKPSGWHKRVGGELAALRRRAGLTVEEVAAVLEEDRDGAPKPVGWVRGVEEGRYAATNWDIREWCKICGAGWVEKWEIQRGRSMNKREMEFFTRLELGSREEVAS